MSAPETEAGRALLALERVHEFMCDTAFDRPCDCRAAGEVAAIEREARQSALAEAIRRVEGLDVGGDGNSYRYVRGETVTVLVDRAAVLSILRDLASRDTGDGS